MMLDRTTILSTPLEICNKVREHFFSAEATLDICEDQSIALNLRLAPNLTVSLRSAVEREGFIKEIQHLKRRMKWEKLCNGNQVLELESERFSILQPLSDWQRFRRVMYENTGRSCVDVIVNYLEHQGEEEQLRHLGFAPVQVDAISTEADLEYFRRAIERLQGLTLERRRAALTVFQRLYPNISIRILDEKAIRVNAAQPSNNNYQQTLTILRNRVAGQNLATEKLATVLTSQENNPRNAVFLFVGPTGVGKTELAKAVASIKGNRFVRFDMNQFQGDDCTKLFGSSTGIVGSCDKPNFAQEIDRHRPTRTGSDGTLELYEISNLVLLFDEFEKAHSKVKQSLLTLFDEGFCVMNYTHQLDSQPYRERNVRVRYTFKRCVFINTSNLYQQEILHDFQQNSGCEQIVEHFKQLNRRRPLEHSISQEMLGRLTVIPFGFIPRGECYQGMIRSKFRNFCTSLRQELSSREVIIENEALIIAALENQLYGDGTDIRRVERYFEDIRGVIYRNSHLLGPWAAKKIIFFHVDGESRIRFETYLEDLGIYHPMKEADQLRLP